MALSGSIFLVEIIVEDLKSYVNCREFIIKSQFADVFSITLKDPNERDKVLSKSLQNKYAKRKSRTWKYSRSSLTKPSTKPQVQSGQSILFTKDIDNLVSIMKKYPIELSLWSKLYPKYKLASTSIPWSATCIDYLCKVQTKGLEPASAKGEYNVFDEFTSRRMAVVKLNIKLSYLADKITTEIKSLVEKASGSFMYSGFYSEPSSQVNTTQKEADADLKPSEILNPIQKGPSDLAGDIGIIKTIYKGGIKKYKKSIRKKTSDLDGTGVQDKEIPTVVTSDGNNVVINNINEVNKSNTVNSSIISLVKSESDLGKKRQIDVIKSKSCSSMHQDQLNILNYIFGNNTGPFGNQAYCVSYFTVQNDNIDSRKSEKSAPTSAKSTANSAKSSNPESSKSSNPEAGPTSEKPIDRNFYKFKLCDDQCLQKKIDTVSCDMSLCSIDIPITKDLADFIDIKRCGKVTCEHKKFRELPSPPDDRILLDLTSLKKKCCDHITGNEDRVEKLEKVAGGMKAKMKIGDDPCYCECECSFGFTKKTVYCKVCGGYESVGDDIGEHLQFEMPFPCPIYHKVVEKAKAAAVSDIKKSSKKSAGDEIGELPFPGSKVVDSKKSSKKSDKKSTESEEEELTKKRKKKKKANKFKFNYGYTAPKIGHSGCAVSCDANPVPKEMGWLWNSDDVPGMKFRPSWKPGAVQKHVAKLLKTAKHPETVAKKKRKKVTGKPTKPLKRPLIVVQKVDGEYFVTMETMKSYNKPRTVCQVPYEDKPLSTYKIGRTDEENVQRRKKKEREHRRLERDQRVFIQSTFKNMCQDICLKTYQQALGILPDAEKPDCPCYPAEPGPDRTDLEFSCSCSEDSNLPESDTDSDEWFLEFTPPIAHFDPTLKIKKVVHTDNSSQYSYLDYRVKLLDRYGNPVPRFFKGPDGKEECSDLGGFWNKEHIWLEINVDGYVGPDGKWAPNNFIGPNNETIDAELGKFQTRDGTWLVVGIDGYVDSHGKWQYYGKKRPAPKSKKNRSLMVAAKKEAGDKKDENLDNKKSEATWSCFGDVSAKYLSEMGIMGHGHDRKLLLDTLNKLIAQGEDVKLPQPVTVTRSYRKKERVKRYSFAEERRCRHGKPSAKGIVAVDGYGNKTYFKLRNYKNPRHAQRIGNLADQGISVSSFHMPCFRSFISSELMKKEQYDRLVALSKKCDGSKGESGGTQHDTDPYQHSRRYKGSYKRPQSTAAASDKNHYRNVIV